MSPRGGSEVVAGLRRAPRRQVSSAELIRTVIILATGMQPRTIQQTAEGDGWFSEIVTQKLSSGHSPQA
jgi:hypothetical protein